MDPLHPDVPEDGTTSRGATCAGCHKPYTPQRRHQTLCLTCKPRRRRPRRGPRAVRRALQLVAREAA